MDTKAKINQLVSETGVIQILNIDGEDSLRVVVEGAGASNKLEVSVRLQGQADFVLVKEIVGSANEKIKVSTYEEAKIECTVLDATDVAIKVIVASFNEASGSAIEIDVPAGENLTDIEVLSFTSSDGSVVISGDNTTKAIDLKVSLNLDDVQEYPSLANFPPIGQANTLYVAKDTELVYRFSGTIYVEVSPSAVKSVNTQTGDVVLTKSDIGLSNVDNTSDANKPISTATQTALNAKQDSLGFTAENVANKSTDTNLGTSDTLYPSQNAVKVYVDNSVASGSAPDATTLSKGIIQLAGDLAGTASAPTVPALANKYDASNPASYVDATGAAAAAPVQSVAGKVGAVSLDKSDVGLSNVDNTSDVNKPISTATQTALNAKYDSSNPAGYITLAQVPADAVTSVNTQTGAVVLTKSDVELSNVDNTSDANKPISTATQTALNAKYDSSNPAGYITLAQVPADAVTSVNTQTGAVVLTKSDVGLGNVDNTSDANKPISTATQTALNAKQDSLGFTPENVANKSTNTNLGTSDTLYPSQNAVKVYVDNSVASGAAPDATTASKGIIKLAGDLSGTADAPSVPALANKYDASNPAGYVDAIGAAAAAPVQSVAGKVGAVSLDKSDVGLSNVDNTSDANKPISTATQTALNAKQDTLVSATNIKSINGQSILGSGDLTISGGGAVDSVNGQTGVVVLTATDIGLGNVNNTSDADKPISTATQTALNSKYDASNPAGYITLAQVPADAVTSVNTQTGAVVITATDVGLGNVNNTSDADKPISTATQTALNAKYDASNPAGYITLAQVPADSVTSVNTQTGAVVITATDVGLGNVNNTSDADKPVSTATQTALNTKVENATNLGSGTGIFSAKNGTNLELKSLVAGTNVTITSDSTSVTINASGGGSVSDATTTTKGIVKLAGDLGGTADLPTVPGLASKYDASNPAGYITLLQVPITSVNSQTGDVVLTKSDIGLSNVDNTSDANKPVSTATQNALNLKQDSLGFTPENVTNKSTTTTLGTSDTLYPTQNAVKTYADTLASGKANTDLSNLTVTAIPSGVAIRSVGLGPTPFQIYSQAVGGAGENSSALELLSGASTQGASGNIVVSSGTGQTTTGIVFIETNKAATGASGSINMSTGAIGDLFPLDNSTNTSATGAVNFSTGSITNTSNTTRTGAVNIFSGTSNSQTGTAANLGSGIVSIFSGSYTGNNGSSGQVQLFSGNATISAGTSGTVFVQSGAVGTTSGTTNSGQVLVRSGTAGRSDLTGNAGNSGQVTIESGAGRGTDGGSGAVVLRSGTARAWVSGQVVVGSGTNTGASATGAVDLLSGAPAGTGGSGNVRVFSGNTVSGASGTLLLSTGASASGGATGNLTLQTGTTSGTRGNILVNAPNLDMQSNKIIKTAEFYFGDPNTDGTYRIRPDGNNLVTERREGGVYVVKQTITP